MKNQVKDIKLIKHKFLANGSLNGFIHNEIFKLIFKLLTVISKETKKDKTQHNVIK